MRAITIPAAAAVLLLAACAQPEPAEPLGTSVRHNMALHILPPEEVFGAPPVGAPEPVGVPGKRTAAAVETYMKGDAGKQDSAPASVTLSFGGGAQQ